MFSRLDKHMYGMQVGDMVCGLLFEFVHAAVMRTCSKLSCCRVYAQSCFAEPCARAAESEPMDVAA